MKHRDKIDSNKSTNTKLNKMKNTKRERKGFTLVEILLVIATIGITAAIVLVAINPNRQIAQVRNAQRRSDTNTIYKALEQYLIDNQNYPEGITGTPKVICNTGSKTTTDTLEPIDCTDKVDLRVLVPTYLAEIPTDPSGGVYEVYINSANNRIGVEAAGVELGQSIVLNPIVSATGGDITTINQNGIWYKVHTFLTSGTFEVTGGSLNVEYLVVGGGGHGGYSHAGGGGGGGFREGNLIVTGQTNITVGSGAPTYTGGTPVNGGNSIFSTIVAAGGGSGGREVSSGSQGGSGGGSAANSIVGGAGNTPSTTPSQGNNGGAGSPGDGVNRHGGGGGGAGSAGQAGNNTQAGTGGNGAISSIRTGTDFTYAGGGGGGGYYGTNAAGGSGGGGEGKTLSSGVPVNGDAGTANTGGGGGGGSAGLGTGGAGGSGIVIVRYVIPAP